MKEPDDVVIKVNRGGICGLDVHMAQEEKDGYIFYPGLTGFPSILGHEFSGVAVEAGKNASDKRTNKPFKGGAQGHSGHGNFPRVIECMASGMDMTPMSTK